MTSAYWLGVLFGGVVLVSVFLRMRNSGMKEHYATWWIVIATGSFFFSVLPGALKWVSEALGVVVPLNLGFFVAGIILLLLSLRFSVDLSQAFEDRRRLTEEIAILRAEVEQLRDRVEERSDRGETQAGPAAREPGPGHRPPGADGAEGADGVVGAPPPRETGGHSR